MVLHHLRRIDEKVDNLREDNREIKARLSQLEATVAQVHVTLAEHSLPCLWPPLAHRAPV
jgi:hypothetical protein